MKIIRLSKQLIPLSLGLFFMACSNDNNTVEEPVDSKQFMVSIVNLTNDQPFSPPLVIGHNAEYQSFQLGETASNALEQLAESGDVNPLRDSLAEIGDNSVFAITQGDGLIGAGQRAEFLLEFEDAENERLTLMTMLVNTNDAFTGVNSVSISDLLVGESTQAMAYAWDAGTEENDELASTIPGPAGGGEGYNASRNDLDFVAIHPGVMSVDTGLTSSVLTEAHRFDNFVALVTIQRMQ